MTNLHKAFKRTLLFTFFLFAFHFLIQTAYADTHWAPNGNHIYNTNSSNVGIGTTSPAYKLEVSGSNKVANFIDSSSYVGVNLDAASGYGSSLYFQEAGSDKYLIGWDSGNEAFRFVKREGIDQTNMVIEASGDIGIGTTAPAYKLDVVGSNRVASLTDNSSYVWLNLNAATDYGSSLYFQEGGSDKYLIGWDASGDEFRFVKREGTDQTNMVIEASGNVGIGTTSPDAELEVEGSNNVLRLTDTSGWVGMQLNAANSQRSTLYFQEGGSNKYEISWEGGSDFLKFYGEGVTDMVIDSSGNVGIGTTSPDAELEVEGSNKVLRLTDTTSWVGMELNAASGQRSSLYFKEAGTDKYEISWEGASDYLKFYGEGNTDMVIKSDGKVGIGDTSPDALLHVADVGTRNFQIGDDAYISDTNITNGLGLYGVSDSSQGKLKLGTGGATIHGKSNGDICIGDCD